MIEPLFSPHETMTERLFSDVGPIRILDVGATEYVGGAPPPYQPLRSDPFSTVVAFDPEWDASSPQDGQMILPFAIGDGQKHLFHICAAPMTSSILEPNITWISRFENLAELCRVVETRDIETAKLDSIPEAKNADFLKIDVQGATMLVLENSMEILKHLLVIQAEVEFGPIYRDEPGFGEISNFLSSHGFEFHHFRDFGSARDLTVDKSFAFGHSASRHMWADAVFVPTESRLSDLDRRQLLLLATILHDCYNIQDLAHSCLSRIDGREGSDLAQAYRAAVLLSDKTSTVG